MDMLEVSDDPYEIKLYHMFESCDTEHCGLLDEKALRRLCTLLELHDKGSLLIKNLIADGTISRRVSFSRFKEALLQFLGMELDSELRETEKQQKQQQHQQIMGANLTNNETERVLVISDKETRAANKTTTSTYGESPHELSDREVAPKLVVGNKKYGRRSRPQPQSTDDDNLSFSDSEHYDDEHVNAIDNSCIAVQRSSSQTDIMAANRNNRRSMVTLNGSKLKRCSSLPAQRKKYDKKQQHTLQQKQHVEDSLKKTQNASSAESLGVDIILRTKNSYTPSSQCINENNNGYYYLNDRTSLAKDAPTHVESLPMESIIDIWERANITNGRNVLLALGFDETEINLVQLTKVLEEEVRNQLEEEDMSTHATFVRSLLALQSAELSTLRVSCRHLHDENAKLRADNREANRRVAMLAIEIDERHATLEDTSKKELRTLEQRHANILKELTVRMGNDREHWTQLTGKLEERIKNFEQEEIKLRTELELLRNENDEMDIEHKKAQRQLSELFEQNTQLNQDIAKMERLVKKQQQNLELKRTTIAPTRVQVDDNDHEEDDDNNDILHMTQKIANLQLENTQLRDKNDELVVELENLNFELVRLKAKLKKTSTTMAVMTSDNEEILVSEESDRAIKRRGDSPTKTQLIEENSPRLGKLRKCSGSSLPENDELDVGLVVDELEAGKALDAELQNSSLTVLQKRILELEQKLLISKDDSFKLDQSDAEIKTMDVTSAVTLEDRCKELEASLEQMQRAYEDCEDYWQGKLGEERQIFEKERQIYEEEQQESDKKFTELMEKVREYEEQFSKESRLSPIEEKDILEQQYVDLEREAEEFREQARKSLAQQTQEIESLQQEIADLRMRLGESVEILTGATEMHTEAKAAAAVAASAFNESPASSPISYLWQQSTIQAPAKHIEQQFANFTSNNITTINNQQPQRNSETVFSSTADVSLPTVVDPIKKPSASLVSPDADTTDIVDSDKEESSVKSIDTHSVASTHSIHNPIQLQQFKHQAIMQSSHEASPDSTTTSPSPTPSGMKEDLKRLKFFEISLKERIKDLSLQRDGLVMELQQLHEARPVLEKAYARTAHPTLIQRVNQLELKNRHLQNVIKQHQQYTESLMQQSWRQHQMELNELHTRVETQNVIMTEQAHRLQNADVLVKDLYVENSHLTATVQRLEQQQVRTQMLHSMQQHSATIPPPQPPPHMQHHQRGLSGMP